MNQTPVNQTTAHLLTRISGEFADMSRQMHRMSDDFAELRAVLVEPTTQTASQPSPTMESPPPGRQVPPMTGPIVPTPPMIMVDATSTPAGAPATWMPAPPIPGQAMPNPAAHNQAAPNPAAPNPRRNPAMATRAMPPNPTHLPAGYSPPPPAAPPPWPPSPQRSTRPALTDRIATAFRKGTVASVLAAAGVGVTLIGIVLLLVLAAQAGILRPEVRVAGGAVFAIALVVASTWWHRRPAGHTGAVALAATGVAAGYLDVLAATRFYEWLSVPAALSAAAVIAGAGLALSRMWNSQALGVLVVVPVAVLAPALTQGVDIVLVSFMLVLAAASGWVQLGRDWTWLYLVRMAAPTLPLVLIAVLAGVGVGPDTTMWTYALAAGLTVVIGLGSALVALPSSSQPALLATITAATSAPVLLSGALVDDLSAASLIATCAAALLLLVVSGPRMPGVTTAVREIWSMTVALQTLVAVATAFNGGIDVAVILGFGTVVAMTARRSTSMARIMRGIATTFVTIGGIGTLSTAPPADLAVARAIDPATAATTLVQCVLLVGAVWILAGMWIKASRTRQRSDRSAEQLWGLTLAVVALYAVTEFTVTAGVLVAGAEEGFFAGHLMATITWMIAGGATLAHASRLPSAARTPLLAGGLAVVAAALAKLFLFDLATLDGMFRVLAFIVTGLLLLAMGAWFARSLSDDADTSIPHPGPATSSPGQNRST